LATLDDLTRSMINLDEGRTLELARELVAGGQTTRVSLLSAGQHALRVVGERYERRDYFLAALIMAGELFKEVMDIVQSLDQVIPKGESRGLIVLGTVAGDIHDIGKSIFQTAAQTHGFEVVDIGVNVPKEDFLEMAKQLKPDFVCCSGLIAAAFKSMRETAQLLRAEEAELGYRPFIVIGGGTVDSMVAAYVGADAWTTDAVEGVHMCERLLSQQPPHKTNKPGVAHTALGPNLASRGRRSRRGQP
jgi:dimethylamine corrinoid protein